MTCAGGRLINHMDYGQNTRIAEITIGLQFLEEYRPEYLNLLPQREKLSG